MIFAESWLGNDQLVEIKALEVDRILAVGRDDAVGGLDDVAGGKGDVRKIVDDRGRAFHVRVHLGNDNKQVNDNADGSDNKEGCDDEQGETKISAMLFHQVLTETGQALFGVLLRTVWSLRREES